MRCRADQLLQIEQGVDFANFNAGVSSSKKAEISARLGIYGKRVAIYTAHLNVASDLEPVLQAWKRVVISIPDALLLVVGGGPLLVHYQRRSKNLGLDRQVIFTGEVPHSEVSSYLALSEVALLFFSERLVNAYRSSLKLREYFAAGIPVVCNDFGELRQYSHFTYQSSSSIMDYASRICQVLEGSRDGRELKAQDIAQERFDWDRIIASAEAEIAKRIPRR